tara:strand:- start:2923 stop:3387 length:465 start_codon:yes stop_codon:yes gene_type:complete
MSLNIETWGPNIWYFFHALAEKINNDKFIENKSNLVELIKIICSNLPCPECSNDAIEVINKTNFNVINTKEDFKNYIFNFHNHVNKKIGNPIFLYQDLDNKYCNINIYITFNNLIRIFNQNSNNAKLMNHSMQRQNSVKIIKNLFNSIKKDFDN